jgi:hypothetical protein
MPQNNKEDRAQDPLKKAGSIKKSISEFGPAYESMKLQYLRRDFEDKINVILNELNIKADRLLEEITKPPIVFKHKTVALFVSPKDPKPSGSHFRVDLDEWEYELKYVITKKNEEFYKNSRKMYLQGEVYIPYYDFIRLMIAFFDSLKKGELDALLLLDPKDVLRDWLVSKYPEK